MALTIFALGACLGAWLGSSVAGAVAERSRWRAAFLVLGMPGVAVAFLVWLTVREPRRGQLDDTNISGQGAAEKALLEAGFPHVYILRPAYIYPVPPRKEPTLSYRLFRVLYPAFRLFGLAVRSDDLGRVMVDVSVQEAKEPRNLMLENRDILSMVRSKSPRLQ